MVMFARVKHASLLCRGAKKSFATSVPGEGIKRISVIFKFVRETSENVLNVLNVPIRIVSKEKTLTDVFKVEI
jgi:hypothetical protein